MSAPGRLMVAVAATCLAGLAWTPRPAAAQDRPAVFIHGLRSIGSDWGDTAARLQADTAIDARVPTLDWTRTFQDQAAALAGMPGFTGLPGSTVAVGHSNGGVVAREWARYQDLSGIVTIGTPHHGAPILSTFYNWIGFEAATPAFLNEVLRAFGTVSGMSWTFAYVQGALAWASDFSIWSVAYLATTLGLDTKAPILAEMQPGSAYLQGLNSASNLQREAIEIPNRVGIASIAHDFYWAGPAHAIVPDYADQVAAALYSSAYGLLYWSGYIFSEADPSDVVAMEQSASLAAMANYLLSVDPFYCRLISSPTMSECIPNDGVLPYTAQQYPGAANFLIGVDNDGPAHAREKQRADVLYEALVWYLHVPPRLEGSGGAEPGSTSGSSGSSGSSSGTDGGGGTSSSGSSGSGSAGGTGTSASRLMGGEALHAGDYLESSDGRFRLIYQYDGNLVLYDTAGVPLWASGTDGTSTGAVAMQTDGNLVMYDAGSGPVWTSEGSYGHPGAYLVLQMDGNLVIYDTDGTPLWATNTVQ